VDRALTTTLAERLAALVREDVGSLTDEEAAMVAHASVGYPRRSRAVADAGGTGSALEAALSALGAVETKYHEFGGEAVSQLLALGPEEPDRDQDAGLVALHLVEWWCAQYPDAPVRLGRTGGDQVLATFAPRPGADVTACALLLFEWPAEAPPVVTAASLLDAMRGSHINPESGSLGLDVEAFVATDAEAPPPIPEHDRMHLVTSVPAEDVDKVLTGQSDAGTVPGSLVDAAWTLRPWLSAGDSVSVVTDPDTRATILTGEAFVLSATR